MGYIQRGDSWRVSVSYKRLRETATVATEELAKEKEIELKAELIRRHREMNASPEAAPVAPVSAPAATSWGLGHAIDKTFELHWNGSKSEWWYKLKCKVLRAHFGDEKPLHEIDTAAVDAFRTALKDKGNGQATINHHLATLSMVFKIAHQRGGVAMKPVLGIKKARRPRIRWVTEQEEKIMLALLEQRAKPEIIDWLKVLLDTGMRPEESRQMTGQWCEFREGVVTVQPRPDTGWTPKSEKGYRSIPMTTRVRAILERRCLEFPKGSLFPYAWDVFTNQWDVLRAAMQLDLDPDFVPYSTRHTFATRLAQRGVAVEIIQRLMGHSTLEQTMEYVKLGAKQYVEAMKVLEPKATE